MDAEGRPENAAEDADSLYEALAAMVDAYCYPEHFKTVEDRHNAERAAAFKAGAAMGSHWHLLQNVLKEQQCK
ncbi:hypothetical protein [Paraburkholderia youngii]|uniref:hypothetical protein n=1 Tax=Paraburkholderia youngii TaxID=2782701 RepID=UPI0015904865|nr:hypothetical protein [Paraburkholderia youngii]NUX58710.1 hypothetical protein [Paraburkholderia youngii]